jgi:transcriptional regulator with XRE-family HTH domain
MSERLGIDRSYLAEVDSGKIEICVRNLDLIAQGFEMEAWQLLNFAQVPAARSKSNCK